MFVILAPKPHAICYMEKLYASNYVIYRKNQVFNEASLSCGTLFPCTKLIQPALGGDQ